MLGRYQTVNRWHDLLACISSTDDGIVVVEHSRSQFLQQGATPDVAGSTAGTAVPPRFPRILGFVATARNLLFLPRGGVQMGSIVERVVEVEVKVDTFRADVTDLKSSVDRVETKLEERITHVETELKGAITALGTELKAMFAALEARMERRFDAVDRRFYWVLGIQFTTLLTIIAGLFGMISKLL